MTCHSERSEESQEILRLRLRMTRRAVLFVAVSLSAFIAVSGLTAHASTHETLKSAIEEKSKELLELNNQIRETQDKIEGAQTQQRSLKTEIRKIDYSISQLNLSIKSSQINIEKTGLELEEIQGEINRINDSIANKRLAIVKLLRQLYEKGQEGILVALLKHSSLSDSLLESQTIADLNTGLSLELENLISLNLELTDQFRLTSDKKGDIEQENRNLKNRRGIVQDQKEDRQDLLVQTKNQEKLFASLLDTLAERRAEISEEIEKIEEELRLTIDPSLLPIPRPGVLGLPADGRLTQEYGHTHFSSNYPGKFHNGIDLGAPIGTPVVSAESGQVLSIGDQDAYSRQCYRGAYGKFIVVEHDNNLVTMYAHLSRIAVQAGDSVRRGDLIGYMGSTGYSTGSHLHFTVYAGPTFYMGPSRVCGPMPLGGHLNPLDYVEL